MLRSKLKVKNNRILKKLRMNGNLKSIGHALSRLFPDDNNQNKRFLDSLKRNQTQTDFKSNFN